MDKYVVQEILNYIPEKKFIYTEENEFELEIKRELLTFSKYYETIYFDCLQDILNLYKPDHIRI
tara:strand:- start:12 stop:203 length:192 start_codon:yes stop_codon:yes gene_type:complete